MQSKPRFTGECGFETTLQASLQPGFKSGMWLSCECGNPHLSGFQCGLTTPCEKGACNAPLPPPHTQCHVSMSSIISSPSSFSCEQEQSQLWPCTSLRLWPWCAPHCVRHSPGTSRHRLQQPLQLWQRKQVQGVWCMCIWLGGWVGVCVCVCACCV